MASHGYKEKPVCFGSFTALELLSAATLHACCYKDVRMCRLPSSAPSLGAVKQAQTRLSETLSAIDLSQPLHVFSRSHSQNRRSQAVSYHVGSACFEGNAFLEITPGVITAGGPLAFIQLAAILPFIELLKLGFELCGSYRRPRSGKKGAYQVEAITSTSAIKKFLEANPGLRGVAKARNALRYIRDGAESPREAICAILFGLPPFYGGYGLGMPTMGYEVQCTSQAQAITGKHTLRCDLYWKEARIDIEYQSREFHEGEFCRARDSRRANALRAMGIDVLSMTGDELDSLDTCDAIASTVRKALGKRDRTRVKDFHKRKVRLRAALGLPNESLHTYDMPRRFAEVFLSA